MNGRWAGIAGALFCAELAACSFFVDTSDLSGGANDAGNSGDSAIAGDSSTSGDAALADASDADSAVAPSSTLVQERGSSASGVTSLDVSVAENVTPGNSLLLVVSGSEEDPISVQGGGTWNQIARSGNHVATSMWLATDATGGSTSVTLTWTDSETTAGALLMEWTGTLKKVLDVEAHNTGTDITAGPIASAPGNVLVAGVGMHNHSVGAPSGGFTFVDSVARDDLQVLVAQSAPGAGTFSAGWTAVTGDGWDSILVAFTGN